MANGSYEIVGDPLLRRPGGTAPAGRSNAAPPRPPRPAPAPIREALRPPVHHSAPGTEFRPDIEGLRALAVVSVLLYHAHLGPFEGGYIGVDVFFVLSGFLITRLLVGEVGRTGTVSLPRFWARRARRLLPASTLVVVATVLAARSMVDPLTQGFVNRSAVAASGFAANLLFWTRGGYSQLTLPEPLLHFWSLAVEEQFYIFWPLILLGVSRLGGHFRRLAAVVVVAVGVPSLVACILVTPERQSFAFYWLPTRAWELLAGAALALAGPGLWRHRASLRGIGAWLGLAVIVGCMVTYDDPAFGFPGAKAILPVAATVLVVVGGVHSPVGPGTLLSLAPLQWVGRHSYALYLWHFPILVLAEAKWGPLPWGTRVLLLGLSVVAAAVSFRYVEDPVRNNTWLARIPRRSLALGGTLAATGVGMALVMVSLAPSLEGTGTAASATVVDIVDDPVATSLADPTATTATGDTTVTGSTAAPTSAVASTDEPYPANPAVLVRLAEANAGLLEQAAQASVVPSNLRPSLKEVYDDKPRIYDDGCILGDNQTAPGECVYGSTGSSSTVVLFGDSHAGHWFPAFEKAAKAKGWRLVVMTKMACPVGDIPLPNAAQTRECRQWRRNVFERLAQIRPDLVVATSIRYKGTTVASSRQGLDTTMEQLRPLARQVLVLGDTPTPNSDVPSCVAAHLRSVDACRAARSEAEKPLRLAADAQVAAKHDALFASTTDWLCTDRWCPVVIGDVLAYRDETHLTTAAATLLTPYIQAAVSWALSA